MTTWPIRLRLTLGYAAVMAVVLGLVGWYGYARLAAGLDADLDRELAQRVQDVSGPLSRPGSSLQQLLGRGYIEHGESFAELLTPSGRVLEATPTLRGRPLLRPAQAGGAATSKRLIDVEAAPGLDEPARLLAVPFMRSGRQLVLVVGATRENGLEVQRAVRGHLLVAGPLLLLISSGMAYLLAGRALRPVERMRRQAASMSTVAGRRLVVPESRDEIARLGHTLNDMLARLNASVEAERRFVSNASHELRTPLSLLRTELDLARLRPRTREDLQAAVDSASAEVDRLIGLANDLLVLARDHGSRLRLDRVDLVELVHDCLQRRTAEERERVTTVLEPSSEVLGDLPQLRRALDNLLDNALVHGGGRVRIDTVRCGHGVEVHVLDSGPGVDAQVLPHVFERFSHGATSRGSGLGLAVVADIARVHGGSAGLVNLDDGGADAWITLPNATAEPDAVPG